MSSWHVKVRVEDNEIFSNQKRHMQISTEINKQIPQPEILNKKIWTKSDNGGGRSLLVIIGACLEPQQ
jgi:hypothetical protein